MKIFNTPNVSDQTNFRNDDIHPEQQLSVMMTSELFTNGEDFEDDLVKTRIPGSVVKLSSIGRSLDGHQKNTLVNMMIVTRLCNTIDS